MAVIGTFIAIVLIILSIIAAILAGIAAAIAALVRTGEIPEDFFANYTNGFGISNETDKIIQSFLRDGLLAYRDDIESLSIFFPDDQLEKFDFLSQNKNNDNILLSSSDTSIEAKASCSAIVETSNIDIFDYVVEREEPEQRLSNVFEETIMNLLFDATTTNVSSVVRLFDPTDASLLNEETNFTSSSVFDVYFTVTKAFSCRNETQVDDTVQHNMTNIEKESSSSTTSACDSAYEKANTFIQNTTIALEEAADSGYLNNKLKENGLMSGVGFIESQSTVDSISCDLADSTTKII